MYSPVRNKNYAFDRCVESRLRHCLAVAAANAQNAQGKPEQGETDIGRYYIRSAALIRGSTRLVKGHHSWMLVGYAVEQDNAPHATLKSSDEIFMLYTGPLNFKPGIYQCAALNGADFYLRQNHVPIVGSMLFVQQEAPHLNTNPKEAFTSCAPVIAASGMERAVLAAQVRKANAGTSVDYWTGLCVR